MSQVLYRYERNRYSEYFEPMLILQTYPVIKTTEKGFWILEYGLKKWVSNDSKKRFAYPTKEEAYVNFIKRTERCVKILKAQLRRAEAYVNLKIPVEAV